MKEKTYISLAIKTFIIGATMCVPGLSGGSIAMVLGIYDKLITSISDILSKNFKKALVVLIISGIFGLLGFFSASPFLSYLLTHFYSIVMLFFIGAIVGSIPMIVKKSDITKDNWYYSFFVIIGVIFVYLISYIPEGAITIGESSFIIQFICGLLVSIGFVLPGISFTYLLAVLGLYEAVINNVAHFNIIPLIPMGIGLLVGIFAFSGLLKIALEKYPSITFPIILGFVLGSIYPLFPSLSGSKEIILSSISFVLGLVIVFFTSKKE